MPTVIQGFEVRTKPKDTSLESFPVFIKVIVSIFVDATALGGAETVDIFAQVAPLPMTDDQKDPGQKEGSL